MSNEVLIAGDIHGDWAQLNTLLNKHRPQIVLQAGDFGWWPNMEINKPVIYRTQKKWVTKGIKPKDTRVYFTDGNHEMHDDLVQDGKIHELYPNVFHASRGSKLTLPDGRVVLFIGGAESIDKAFRKEGFDWFAREIINDADYGRAMQHNTVDIVISHTAPLSFDMKGAEEKLRDPSRIALQNILEHYKPSLWYFGHWHKFRQGQEGDTKWTALDYPAHGGRWWIPLEKA